jgi:hypothetical protein
LIYLFKLDKIYVESKNENQPMRNEIKGDWYSEGYGKSYGFRSDLADEICI